MSYQQLSINIEEDILNNYIDVTKTNLDGYITYASQMFCDTMEYTKDELIGKSHNIVKYEHTDKKTYDKLWNQISNNQPYTGVIQNKTKSGKAIWFEVLIKPLFDNNGEKNGYIAYRKNITTQKQLQLLVDKQIEEIREKDRQLNEQSKILAMGKMIENIAHQWRQPLSVISTVASGMILKLEHNMFDKKEAIQNLQVLEESSQYLSNTIDDFRDFFKSDKEKRVFSLNKNCTKCISMLQDTLKNNNIKIIKDEKTKDILINGYESELSKSIINILNNAKDALNEQNYQNKFIFAEIKSDDKNAYITISDNGGGIDKNIIDNIFEPYFTTKHQSQGTGLGLYMTKEIIEKHFKGEIKAENKTINYENNEYVGASFIISIPL
ncbi:MAG: PAS domain-containing sensor histidine kinase [Campylobacterota bacterium]|nr:PAS domain-containing sensor histidine kinase [Campylobacterota bacterium]